MISSMTAPRITYYNKRVDRPRYPVVREFFISDEYPPMQSARFLRSFGAGFLLEFGLLWAKMGLARYGVSCGRKVKCPLPGNWRVWGPNPKQELGVGRLSSVLAET